MGTLRSLYLKGVNFYLLLDYKLYFLISIYYYNPKTLGQLSFDSLERTAFWGTILLSCFFQGLSRVSNKYPAIANIYPPLDTISKMQDGSSVELQRPFATKPFSPESVNGFSLPFGNQSARNQTDVTKRRKW